MKDEQVERILNELGKTRESFDSANQSFDAASRTFDAAIRQIKWNKINTIIQYVMIFLVVSMLFLGSIYYLNERKASCERGNDLRVSIVNSLDVNAASIGIALAIVSEAPQEKFQEYMDAYSEQDKPEALETREC